MSDKVSGLPVSGYKPQSKENVDLVNINKQTEERILRLIDEMTNSSGFEKRWLAIARTHIELGFMALNRSVFKPGRVALPEDQRQGDSNKNLG